jgi:hypothetical protein
MADKEFPQGFFFKEKHEKQADFVLGSVSIKVDEAVAYLQKNKNAGGYVNLQLLKSKTGKKYFELDTWEPKKKEEVETESTSFGGIDF